MSRTEEWRSVTDYEGLYEVSDFGRVRSIRTRTNSKAGAFLKPIRLHHAYCVRLSRDGVVKPHFVHRLVTREFIGQIADGQQVNHRNRDTADNRIENLEYVSPLQNTRHAIENGGRTTPRGEMNGQAKVDEAAVRRIRERVAAGERQSPVAREYGIDPSAVSNIVRRRNWAHVLDEEVCDL